MGYLPCNIDHKMEQLDKWITFFNKKPFSMEDVLIRVPMVYYWFVGIHIFEDGNSRVGRFLLSYFMYKHGCFNNMNFSISKSLKLIGGKEVFVKAQGDSWEENNISLFSK